MKDVRWIAAVQLILAAMAPSLLPFIGTDGVLVLLAGANAAGGVAGLYGWKSVPEIPKDVSSDDDIGGLGPV